MSTRVRVGDVEVRVEADLSNKEIKSLLRLAAGIALGLAEAAPEPERNPVGFAAHVERASDLPAEDIFTDDELE